MQEPSFVREDRIRAEVERLVGPRLECWVCKRPAVTIGYGFAVCAESAVVGGVRMNCSEIVRRTAEGTL